jgi:hypothetical protein
MDGTEYIGSKTTPFGDEPRFTRDGAYVYSRMHESNVIAAISVSSGEAFEVPCPGCDERNSGCSECTGVVPMGGSLIAWLDAENRLTYADLAAESPVPQPTEIVVPTTNDAYDQELLPFLIAGTDGLAIAHIREISGATRRRSTS